MTELRAVSSFTKYADNISADAISKQEKLAVLAARNGYECAQILIFPDQDTDYDVKISDLCSSDGTAYASDNVTAFAEKYIYVDRNWQTNGLPTGNYPDALLPMDAAKNHGQTHICAGSNKGIWLEFFIPADQKPGIYRGTVAVEANGLWEYPVELEVLDLLIPAHTGVRSLFHTNVQHMSRYEKGDMTAMYEKYLQYLLQHRICQTSFMISEGSDESVAKYAEKAAQLSKQGYNTFSIPSIEKEYNGYMTFSDEWLEKYLFALAQKSLECGIDLIKQVAFYDWRIDEPFGVKYKPGQEQESVERFSCCVEHVADRCSKLPEFESEFGKRIISSLRNTCHVITDYYERQHFPNRQKLDKNGEPYQYDCEKVTLCPKFDGYDTPELAAPYGSCQERWWYGCNAPNAPYVSYHIDDAAFSPRIIGGLMARYGIVGNLYWANNIYTEINTTGKPLFLDDPYQTAHRGFGANGDGAILYPGSIYGVDGPVGCIRLKNIREGNQDWELLNQAQQCYQASGASFWDVYDRQICYIADAAKIDSMSGDYGMIHQSLMRLSEAALSSLGLIVRCRKEDDGVYYTLHTRQECKVYVDGQAVAENDGAFCFRHLYEAGNWFELKLCTAGTTRIIPMHKGRGMKIILHEILFENGAVTVQQGAVTRNPDEIRREITVELDAPDTVHIRLEDTVTAGQELGIEVKTVEPCFCTVYADGYEQEKRRMKTIPRWNRIQIPTDTEGFRTNGINLCFEQPGKVGIGEVFIRR